MGAVVAAWAATAGGAQAATTRTVEPLNQYSVSGKITGDQLAQAGYDMHEVDAKGRLTIVATPGQAKALADKGATVEPLNLARTMAAPSSPLSAPSYGYDVFRPWSLQPAACPTTCSTARKPLKDWYHEMAVKHPDIVAERKIGTSVMGQDIMAYKLTTLARWRPDASKPTVLFESTQHAREWISAEVNRRLFAWFIDHRRDPAVRRLLRRTEVWFMPLMNPDGYDYTFSQGDSTDIGTRLWRKNLRDVNADGVIDPAHDGVDLNRNWPAQWNYDLEGSSDEPSTETYHGTGPASEPEVAAARRLHRKLRPRFLIDYHSYGPLILWPEGWQVETDATDAPLMRALAGDDRRPAIEGYDPDVAGELYTTNGDITGDAWSAWGTQAYTVELSGGTGDGVGGTTGEMAPAGFIYADSEAQVQAEFEKNLPFALDLVTSAWLPDFPKSHLGNEAPNYVPSTFAVSYGDPQTVEVNVKRSLGDVWAVWTINDGPLKSARAREWAGGERYGKPGTYYHRMRAAVTGTKPGDTVKVGFINAIGLTSETFDYTVKADSGAPVLLLTAEDYTGRTSALVEDDEPHDGPRYTTDYAAALTAAGVPFDVYDVDAMGRQAPSPLGVLSHYKAVVWQTGDDLYVREPGQPGGTGTSKLFDDELLAVRDYLNDGGKLLAAGQYALQGGWDSLLYNPLGAPPNPFCASNQVSPSGDDSPEGQVENCVAVSNDFQQYYLGAWLPIIAADSPASAAEIPFKEVSASPFSGLQFAVDGPDSRGNQTNIYSFLTTSSILPAEGYPQFGATQAIAFDRPPAFDPPTGTKYAFSQATDEGYKRLTRTVDLTGKTAADLSFKVSYDTEPGWDLLFVEAHTVGADDWTTLPDVNGHTSDDTGSSCGQIPLNSAHPFFDHYTTLDAAQGTCAPTGTTGTWNGASGNSGGYQDWKVDLSAYAGQQVEVSISYVSDPAVRGLGVFVDDAAVTADGTSLAATSFEDGLGGWTVAGPPAGSPGNVNDWIQTGSVGYQDGPGVKTADTVLWGFGLEGVDGAANRATLLRNALTHLGATG